MKMWKLLYIFCIAVFFAIFSVWHFDLFHNPNYGQRVQSTLKENDNSKHQTSAVYGHTFKKCFNIPALEIVSINCDFMKHQRLLNKKGNCRENTQVVRIINGKGINSLSKNHCERFVTLARYAGRTGNQMFEIASLIGIAFRYDMVPVIPLGTILSEYFNLPDIFAKESNKLLKPVRLKCSMTHKVCNISRQVNRANRNVSVSGYLQSWKYFDNIRTIIKSVFTFKEKHLEHAKQYLSSVSIKRHYRVCIHVRRGDITSIHKLSRGYAIPNNTFFENAKQFYLKKYDDLVQFIVISQEKEWCRKNIFNVSISHFTSPGDDLALLSLCDHVVVTLGTFGWWGAWLSGGTTVYFDGYPRKGSWLESKMTKEDYYPPSWIGIR